MAQSKQSGFTLIEMVIVVAIIGIMAAIAYPSYVEYVKRGYRTEGMAMLNDAAARQERYFAQNNSYVTDQNNIGNLKMPRTVGTVVSSETGKYTLSVAGNGGGYTLTATQAFGDADCGNLTLNAQGTKGRSGTKALDKCWK